MIPKTLKLSLLTLLLGVSVTRPAHALRAEQGAISGGGGKAVVCRDSHNRVKSIELLDLWEARTLFNRKIKNSNRPVEEQVHRAIESLKEGIHYQGAVNDGTGTYKDADALAWQLRNTARVLLQPDMLDVKRLRGVKLTLTEDSFEVAIPSECQVEQIINWRDYSSSPVIYINQDLVDRMSPTQVAALYVHEAFYAFMRTHHGERNSIRVRRAVGAAFGGSKLLGLESVLPERFAACISDLEAKPVSLIYIFESPHAPGAFGFALESLAGVQAIGYMPVTTFGRNGGMPATLEELVEKIQRGMDQPLSEESVYSQHVEPHMLSPVDFELAAGINILKTNGDGLGAVITTVTSPWHNRQPVNQRLACAMMSKSRMIK